MKINRRNYMAVGAAFALLALILASCGSGGSSNSSTSNVSKAAYIKQADQLCQKIEKDRTIAMQAFAGEHAPEPGTTLSKGDFSKMLETVVIPPIQQEAEQLAELDAPSGADGEEVAEIIEELEAGVKKAEENPSSIVKVNENPFNQVSQRAVKFGFETCARYGSV